MQYSQSFDICTLDKNFNVINTVKHTAKVCFLDIFNMKSNSENKFDNFRYIIYGDYRGSKTNAKYTVWPFTDQEVTSYIKFIKEVTGLLITITRNATADKSVEINRKDVINSNIPSDENLIEFWLKDGGKLNKYNLPVYGNNHVVDLKDKWIKQNRNHINGLLNYKKLENENLFSYSFIIEGKDVVTIKQLKTALTFLRYLNEDPYTHILKFAMANYNLYSNYIIRHSHKAIKLNLFDFLQYANYYCNNGYSGGHSVFPTNRFFGIYTIEQFKEKLINPNKLSDRFNIVDSTVQDHMIKRSCDFAKSDLLEIVSAMSVTEMLIDRVWEKYDTKIRLELISDINF